MCFVSRMVKIGSGNNTLTLFIFSKNCDNLNVVYLLQNGGDTQLNFMPCEAMNFENITNMKVLTFPKFYA